MQNTKYEMRDTRYEPGFTIAELLLALAIMGLLLAAVATAFNASVTNYCENEKVFKTMNITRQALARITTQLRTGHSFKLDDPDNKCTFFTSQNEDITYEYRSSDNRLYLITNSDNKEYVLCDNVTSMSFTKTLTDDGLDFKSIQISMTVSVNDYTRTIPAAVAVRRNISW